MIDSAAFEKLTRKLTDAYPSLAVTLKDDCIVLEGELSNYDDIVAAGFMATTIDNGGVINNIRLKGYIEPPLRVAPISDNKYDGLECDVLIVGGGISGTMIARELSRYDLHTVLVEKESDVALHASSRNDGVIHVGIDLKIDTLKHHYLRQAVGMYKSLSEELDIPFIQRGQLILFSKKWIRPLMFILKRMSKKREIKGVEIWNKEKLLQEEPNIGDVAEFAIYFAEGGIICPYETVIALAEHAIENGVQVCLDTAVLSMEVADHAITSVKTNRGTIYPKYVINAAGTFSDKIAAMAEDQFFTIHPRKGIEAILDKKAAARSGTRSISLYRGSSDRRKDHSKGGGVIPTVDGNVLIGPTAYETIERENFETDPDSIAMLFERHQPMLPNIKPSDVITYFAGIRAATYEEDFIVRSGKWTKNIIHAAGIQSPGLTAAPAIAKDIVRILETLWGCPLPKNPNYNPKRQCPPKIRQKPEEQRHEFIRSNPDYGHIVCRCEEISKGEIIDVLNRPLVVPTLDGIKRRIRAGMGRCQGGFCGPLVTQIIHEHLNIPYTVIHKKGQGTIIVKETKDGTYGDL